MKLKLRLKNHKAQSLYSCLLVGWFILFVITSIYSLVGMTSFVAFSALLLVVYCASLNLSVQLATWLALLLFGICGETKNGVHKLFASWDPVPDYYLGTFLTQGALELVITVLGWFIGAHWMVILGLFSFSGTICGLLHSRYYRRVKRCNGFKSSLHHMFH